jgi:hypothetical protein
VGAFQKGPRTELEQIHEPSAALVHAGVCAGSIAKHRVASTVFTAQSLSDLQYL